ncbi:Putative serine/threonine-protein kinase, active [Septoria linicola]|uniref:non-specific serine/threonine protein kinase n=1 Tax=Septoria linicola TaxID=215465 RepID=A0A9Q9EED5_9PEZI|nr:Putative serine/threonine-protein kinase, active [Septoria linicola]
MSPDEQVDNGNGSDQPAIVEQPPDTQRSIALQIPKTRAAIPKSSSTASLQIDNSEAFKRLSIDGSITDPYDTRSPILGPERDTGLRRIRQNPSAISRNPSSPNLAPHSSIPPSPVASRKSSFAAEKFVATSPTIPFGEDLTRFPSESLHSFSFAHQSTESLHNRQNVLKRSIDFMREKLAWASTSPRIASAQARLAGDEELLSMMELLQRANAISPTTLNGAGLGIDTGPLTGPAHLVNENVFEKSFFAPEQETASPTSMTSPVMGREAANQAQAQHDPVSSGTAHIPENEETPEQLNLLRTSTADDEDFYPSLPTRRPHKPTLKRTYTDTAGYSLQHKLSEAMAQPYRAPKAVAPTVSQAPLRSSTAVTERAPHGHRNAQAQAIFTTEAKTPWTITAANDLACLVFGVGRAEVRKLGIMEVIKEDRRGWLEEKLKNPDSGTAPKQAKLQVPPSGKATPSNSLAAMGNGITAKLLSKPSSRQAPRRAKTSNGTSAPPKDNHHPAHKSRGVLLCGDVVPIQKMNGSTGSASLWVKEKGSNLIWVLEEIAEDVAMLTVDEIGLVLRGSGDLEAIFGLDRVRNGMDVTRLIPAWPKVAGTNTGAIDYDAIARIRRFTARTSNSINIPVTVDRQPSENVFRISSFPHIAGIIVVNPQTMRVSSSNNVFSAALFGHASPDGLTVTELIPGFDKILRVMTDEDKIALVDGIVIPEHSFRRARAILALREGSADAAAIFLRPSGLPAKHRDGAEIMIDVQMRVVKSDRDPIYNETVVEDESSPQFQGSEVVYALWITYSRQLHAVNHGTGPVTTIMSRPGTPPQQPAPGLDETEDEVAPVTAARAESGQTEASVTADPSGDKQTNALNGVDASEPFEHPSPELIEAGVQVITKKKIDDFTILEEMGQGAYGQVKLARYKKAAAKKMVIKYVTKRRILVDTWHRDRRLGTVPLEIHVLDYLRREGMQHANIVEMADFFEDDINYYIEMVPHGLPGMDLFDYIELRVTMEERECRKIFKQVAAALKHLHVNAKVVHRDIKDENVILDGEGSVKLVDFGSAAYIKSGPFDVFVGTIDYAAPEVLRGLPYRGKEQDVWALGILLYTIVYKENPFYSIDEIMDHDLRVPYVMSEDCIDLIRKMLDRDVERRIGIQAVLDHPWCLVVDESDDEGSSPKTPTATA